MWSLKNGRKALKIRGLNEMSDTNHPKLVPYTPSWAHAFKEYSKSISSILMDEHLDIFHVGSTSIEGMEARPIIDIIVTMKNINTVDKYMRGLEESGYEKILPMKGKHVSFVKKTSIPNINLYIYNVREQKINYSRMFDEYLRRDESTRSQYIKLKKNLIDRDEGLYSKEKEDFKSKIIEKLISESQRKQEKTRPYVFPLYFYKNSTLMLPDRYKVSNGSCFFLKVGDNLFGITAYHNIKAFFSDKSLFKNCSLKIGDTEIPDFKTLIIDQDEALDLLTFKVRDPDNISISNDQGIKRHICPFEYTEDEWGKICLDHELVKSGDDIIFTGYPAETRKEFRISPRHCHVNFEQKSSYQLIQRVESYDSRASIVIDEKEMISLDSKVISPFGEMGGYSGCPVMKIRNDENPLIIGVIVEGAPSHYDQRPIYISLLKNVNNDGTIKKHQGFLKQSG